LPQAFNKAINWGMVSLILLTPLAVGSVEPWAFGLMEVTIFLLIAVWLIKHLLLEANVAESQRGIHNLALPAVLLAALVAFQMVPLPPSIEAMVSPSTFELYQKSLPGWPDKPAHNKLRAASPHSQGLVLLPTSGDIAAGATVPFVNIASQSNFFATREPDVESRRGPIWRPLSIDTSLTGPALLKLVGYLCLFLLLVSFPSGEKGETSFARRLLCAAQLAGVLVAAIALAERISPNGKALWVFVPYDWPKGTPWGSRATGPFANPDHLASYLDLVLPIALAAFLMPAAFVSRRRAEARLFFATALIVIAAALLLTSSRGGWLGALFGAAMLAGLWRRSPRHNCAPGGAGIAAWTLLGAFVLLVLLAIGPAGRLQTDARLEETVAQNSIVSRLRPSKLSLKIIQDFPVLGLGLGCWPEVFPRCSEPPWSLTFWNAAHNDYIQWAAETGLLGCGLLVWFFAATLWHVWYGMRRIRPEAAVLVAGCLGGISAVGMHEFFDFPLQIPANALLFIILLAIAVRMTQNKPSQRVDPDIRHSRLFCCIGLVSALVLIAAAITQRKTPYPYNLRQPATLAQAYSLENAHPANARVHLMLARMLTDEMSAKYRMEELRAALWLEPTNPLARDLYVQALLQANNEKEALTEMSRSVSYSPTLDSHLYLEPRMIPWLSFSARRAVEMGFRTAVADHYEGAVQNFASYYSELGEFSAQGALYSETAAKEQDRVSRAEYFVDAGIAYAKAAELKKAEASFRAASAAAPEHSSAYEQLVLLVFAPRNNLAAAKAIVKQGIETGADPFQLYLALGLAAQTSGNNSEAEAALLKAAAIRPSRLEPLIRMGELNLATNKFDQAATWLERATSLDPSSAEAFYDLGLADEGAYEYVAADQAYQQALALAPTDERFKARYAAFRQKIVQSKSDTPKP
jgi:O-antigen ligase/tetratricopeptide (TPR) repeat protein